jgi:hypothetical protein
MNALLSTLLCILCPCLYFARRRQSRRADEARRHEIEESGFNPNDEPTLPAPAVNDLELVIADDSGYQGWQAAERNEWRSVKAAVVPKPVSVGCYVMWLEVWGMIGLIELCVGCCETGWCEETLNMR